MPTRSSTTRRRGKFQPLKETKVTSPSHSPCSTTSVLCPPPPPQETVKHWTQSRWAESRASTTTSLHKFIPTLSRRAWTRLNRLRTGVGRFGANMLRWGLSMNDSCDCGAEQTADHTTSGRCPIYRPHEGINGLIVLNDETRAWLENNALDI